MLLRNLFMLQINNCLLAIQPIKTDPVPARLLNQVMNSKGLPYSEGSPPTRLVPLVWLATLCDCRFALILATQLRCREAHQPRGLE